MTETLQQITVHRADAPVDDPSGLVIEGCPADTSVTVIAQLDRGPARHEARARFQTDRTGRIDTAAQPSTAGTYTGVDPFGLFWSGRPIGPGSTVGLEPLRGTLRVEFAGRRSEVPLVRRWLPPDAIVDPVSDVGVSGIYVRPAGPGPFRTVVAFAGSGGGLGPAPTWAAALARHGFATLAVAYFGAPGLPPALANIPIEVVERAIAWLRARAEVPDRVGVMGISRGSELALLAGAVLPGIGAVVGFSPSGVCWPALGPRGPMDAPAWTFRGASLPYAPLRGRPPASSPEQPFALAPLFEQALADRSAVADAEIAVERIAAPVLLVSGDDDAMWPSAELADRVVRRAAAHGAGHRIRHLRYPAAGHTGVGIPGVPTALAVHHPLDGGHYAFGGTYAGNAAARADSWPRVVAFLADALSSGRRRGGPRR